MTKRSRHNVLINAFLLSTGIAMTGSVLAAQPWVSIPSTANERDEMVVSAGNLDPDSTVTLRITYPSNEVTDQFPITNSKGELKLKFLLEEPGRYGVEVLDATGRTVGKGSLGFIR